MMTGKKSSKSHNTPPSNTNASSHRSSSSSFSRKSSPPDPSYDSESPAPDFCGSGSPDPDSCGSGSPGICGSGSPATDFCGSGSPNPDPNVSSTHSAASFKTLPELLDYISKTHNNPANLNFIRSEKSKTSGGKADKSGKAKDGNDPNPDKPDWRSISTREFLDSINYIALALSNMGLKKGQTFGIMSLSCPEWLMMDLAIIVAGGVSAPIFSNISKENMLFEIKDSKMDYIFTSNRQALGVIQKNGYKFKTVITHNIKKTGSSSKKASKNIITLSQLIKNGKALSASSRQTQKLTKVTKSVRENDLATIIYTSGSTGRPKGVMLSHKNLISQIRGANLLYPLNSKTDRALSFLPLAHIFERMVSYYYLSAGISIYFADDIKNTAALAQAVKPTIMTTVPRMLEKIYSRINEKISQKPLLSKLIAKLAINHANSQNPEQKTVNPFKIIFHKIFSKLVYQKFLAVLGGNLKVIICGGAPLSKDLEKFFINISLPLYQGYGLTESSPVIAANYPKNRKTGSVGKSFPGVEVKIHHDESQKSIRNREMDRQKGIDQQTGEILVCGDNVMRGYLNNPEKTSQDIIAIGGKKYLKTGDLGMMDLDGYLTITGRKKELFKTANGKYVCPIPIEHALNSHPLIFASCIIANNRKFTSCILFPDFEPIAAYKSRHGFTSLTDRQFLKSSFVKKEIGNLISKTNTNLNHWEQVQKYHLALEEISIDTGELTPSMKIKRHIIEEKYQKELDRIYS